MARGVWWARKVRVRRSRLAVRDWWMRRRAEVSGECGGAHGGDPFGRVSELAGQRVSGSAS